MHAISDKLNLGSTEEIQMREIYEQLSELLLSTIYSVIQAKLTLQIRYKKLTDLSSSEIKSSY